MSPAASNASARRKAERRFADAVAFHRAGNLVEAERAYRKAVEADPGHAQALHNLALIRHGQGARDEAIDLLGRAATTRGADAALLNNLGSMLREAGRATEAIDAYRRAVALDDRHLNAHFNLAGLLLDSGDPQGARASFEKVLAAAPNDVAVRNGLGLALLRLDDAAAAAEHFESAVRAAPEDPAGHANLARAQLVENLPEQALEHARRAVELAPDSTVALRVLAQVQQELELYEESERNYGALRERLPDEPEFVGGQARALVELGRDDEALSICDAAIARAPDTAELHGHRGLVLKHMGALEASVEAFERAIELNPDLVNVYNNLGVAWVDLGDEARAQACFAQALERAPDLPETLLNVARTRRNRPEHRDQILHMEQVAERDGLALSERLSLHFALGKAFDDLGEYDRAFAHYARANALKRRTVRFVPERFLEWVQGFHDVFTPEYFARRAGFGSDSERPVFIVGMPRSGTTLVEQILASHPLVHGGGELTHFADFADGLPQRLGTETFYPRAAATLDRASAQAMAAEYLGHLEALDARALRVTDKMPTNFVHLGLISVLFPHARVVHCRRDPMDSCFSNFIQQFGSGHYYSYSLSDIAVYYGEYRRLMEHWRAVLPVPIHEVVYEEMVEDQESVSRRLVAHLGLEWDDACLAFHRTQRTVRTASHWQVRQPIYKTARLRWKNYAAHLEELRAAIGYEPASGM